MPTTCFEPKGFTQTLSGEHLPLQEYRIVRKDGKAVRALLHATRAGRNGVAGLRMCFIDITNRRPRGAIPASPENGIGRTPAGGVAHDFNNILSAILGYATLIKIQNSARERDALAKNSTIRYRRSSRRVTGRPIWYASFWLSRGRGRTR